MRLTMKTISKYLLRRVVVLIVFLFVCAITITSHHVGYKRGDLDGQLRRLPFELGLFLQMHNILENDYAEAKARGESTSIQARMKGNLGILILARLTLLDVERKRFEQIVRHSLKRSDENNQHFEKNVAEGRKIVEGLKIVSLNSVIKGVIKDMNAEQNKGGP